MWLPQAYRISVRWACVDSPTQQRSLARNRGNYVERASGGQFDRAYGRWHSPCWA
ncbi:hypothetical protein LMG33810_002128 [Carnimonas sp. LMG 33810]